MGGERESYMGVVADNYCTVLYVHVHVVVHDIIILHVHVPLNDAPKVVRQFSAR